MKTTKMKISSLGKCNFLTVPQNVSTKMNCFAGIVVTLLLILVAPALASAERERYVLDFNDAHIRSFDRGPATLFLKKTLRDQYPWINMGDLELKKVVLVAKTKLGYGGAELRVGRNRSHNARVDGNPSEFRSHKRYTFDKVRFRNPSRVSRGPWQMDLWGNFIVRKVVLVVEKKRPAHNPEREFWRDRNYRDHRFYGFNWQWR